MSHDSAAPHVPLLRNSCCVDNKRLLQRPRFNYGHCLGRDLRSAGIIINNWVSLGSGRHIWHTITQQKNVHSNTNNSDKFWVDPEQLVQAAAQNTLPSPLSYAGVLAGLLPQPDSPPAAPATPPSQLQSLQCPCTKLPQPLLSQTTIVPYPLIIITLKTHCRPKSCATATQSPLS